MPSRVTKTRDQPWVAEKLAAMPDGPGCYFFKDAKGRVLYVGKAKSLKKRVSSYFTKADHTLKTLRMLAQARDVEYLVVDSEVEALVVESSCIKKYQPRYNVALKDDKSYPYLKLTMSERFPKAEFTRTLKDDGAKYYGPLSAGSVRAMLYLIQNVFQIRDCDLDMERIHPRPCLQFQIKKCSGPCIRAVDEEAYKRQIEGAMHFLEGEAEGVLEALESEMSRAAEEMAYERAAIFRDQLAQVRKFLENQKVVSKQRLDQDYLAIAHVGPRGVGAVLLIRSGKIVGREQYALKVPAGVGEEEILAAFVGQYYTRASTVPKEVVVAKVLPDFPTWEGWLREKKGTKVTFRVPQRGEQRRLMEMATRNAELYLSEQLRKEETAGEITRHALLGLQKALNLPKLPRRIECYDISNLGASNAQRTAVASRVTFIDGRPAKDHYRRYRIQGVEWQDDYAMMRETLLRRLKGYEPLPLVSLQPTPKTETPFCPPDELEPIATETLAAAEAVAVQEAIAEELVEQRYNPRGITFVHHGLRRELAEEFLTPGPSPVLEDSQRRGEAEQSEDAERIHYSELPSELLSGSPLPSESSSLGEGLGVRTDSATTALVPPPGGRGDDEDLLSDLDSTALDAADLDDPEQRIDLLLVDGGKTHLGVALAVIKELGLEGQFEVAGLAKRHEELFVPWLTEPVRLPAGSPELFMVQRVRDEAHRFANAYRKILNSRLLSQSELDRVPGIGPKRKTALLKHFGSIKKLREATLEELCAAPGVSRKTAEVIKATLSASEKAKGLRKKLNGNGG